MATAQGKKSSALKPLLWVSGIGLALYLLNRTQKAAAVERMRFLITGASIDGNLFSPSITIEILAQNPTDQEVQIRSFAGDLFVNDIRISNLSNFTPITIKANSETRINVLARIGLAGLLTQVTQILQGVGNLKAEIHIVGTVNVDGTIIPIDLTQKII